jgi:hypothetical protein
MIRAKAMHSLIPQNSKNKLIRFTGFFFFLSMPADGARRKMSGIGHLFGNLTTFAATKR